MKSYRISAEAIGDLESIWLYTKENWSVMQADRYYNLIVDEIKYVSQNFESGRSMEHIKPGYRVTKVKSHLVFYRKIDEETVEIVRVLHQNMDVKNRL